MTLIELLRPYEPCDTAPQCLGNASPFKAWETCPRGDWLLWALEALNIQRDECIALGYWCAERARQSALRVLPPCSERADEARKAVWASAWAAWAARAAAEPAAWASALASAMVAAEEGGEHLAIADEVRRRIPWSTVEAALKDRGVVA